MRVDVNLAQASDLAWLAQHDTHVSSDWVASCISAGEYIIAFADDARVAYLRFSWFWRTIPYMEMIFVLPDHRRKGFGTRMLAFWEARMAAAGARALLTSSVGEEAEPQAWHARNGYRPCGILELAPLQAEPERFFIKP